MLAEHISHRSPCMSRCMYSSAETLHLRSDVPSHALTSLHCHDYILYKRQAEEATHYGPKALLIDDWLIGLRC